MEEQQGGEKLDRGRQAEKGPRPARMLRTVRPPGPHDHQQEHQIELPLVKLLAHRPGQEDEGQDDCQLRAESNLQGPGDDGDADSEGRERNQVPQEMGPGIVETGQGHGEKDRHRRVGIDGNEPAARPRLLAHVQRQGLLVRRIDRQARAGVLGRGPFLEEICAGRVGE